jgi:hypothetical protein
MNSPKTTRNWIITVNLSSHCHVQNMRTDQVERSSNELIRISASLCKTVSRSSYVVRFRYSVCTTKNLNDPSHLSWYNRVWVPRNHKTPWLHAHKKITCQLRAIQTVQCLRHIHQPREAALKAPNVLLLAGQNKWQEPEIQYNHERSSWRSRGEDRSDAWQQCVHIRGQSDIQRCRLPWAPRNHAEPKFQLRRPTQTYDTRNRKAFRVSRLVSE